jgi:hypothetical protein
MKYCQVFTLPTSGGIAIGGKARIVEGNFDTFAAVGDVRIDKNSLPDTSPEDWNFRTLFVFDCEFSKKWDQILYNGKTDGLKTGIFLKLDDGPADAALVIDEELQNCQLVEVGKQVTKEVKGVNRHYIFDGTSLSIITTKV